MKKIHEVNINGERIFLRKTFLGWAAINPVSNALKKNGLEPLDKKTSMKNLLLGGSWAKLGIIAFIILIVLGSLYEYRQAVDLLNQCQIQLETLKDIGGFGTIWGR